MEVGLVLDTTLVIDMEREIRRGVFGPGRSFTRDTNFTDLYITIITLGELYEGTSESERSHFDLLIEKFELLLPSQETAWLYGKQSARIRETRERIGDNDLWIACIALERGFPVVTRNHSHFSSVSGLKVISY